MSNMIFNNKITKILELFREDYNRRIYGRDIANKLKMNQKTISNILNRLEKEDILKFSTEGKNKYYYLNKINPHIKDIIKLIEIDRKIKFIDNYKKFSSLFNKLEEKTEGILIVFGSYANSSANNKSDLDIVIIGKISDITELEDLYKIKINIVKIDKNKFNKEDILIKEIIRNHIILKKVEEFIELIW